MPENVCFIICPIGDEGSKSREHSDRVFNDIIKPALLKAAALIKIDFRPERADLMKDPGDITRKIMLKIVESPLVIADLTDANPNVFYELAVRHAAQKPVIQIIEANQPIPFDISMIKTIPIGKKSGDWEQIAEQIEAFYKQGAFTPGKETPFKDHPLGGIFTLSSDNLREISDNLREINATYQNFFDKILEELKTIHADNQISEQNLQSRIDSQNSQLRNLVIQQSSESLTSTRELEKMLKSLQISPINITRGLDKNVDQPTEDIELRSLAIYLFRSKRNIATNLIEIITQRNDSGNTHNTNEFCSLIQKMVEENHYWITVTKDKKPGELEEIIQRFFHYLLRASIS